MARLSLLLVIAAACVVAPSAFGDDYVSSGYHGKKGEWGGELGVKGDWGVGVKGGWGVKGDWGDLGGWDEWSQLQSSFKHVPVEMQIILRSSYRYLVRRGVPPRKAMVHCIRGVEVLVQLWAKILHHDYQAKILYKDYDFHDDIHTISSARLAAQHAVPWVGGELKLVDNHYSGILGCVTKILHHVLGSVLGGPGHGGLLGGILGGHPAHGQHGFVGGGGVVGGYAGGIAHKVPVGAAVGLAGSLTKGHGLDGHDGLKKVSYGTGIGAGIGGY